MAADMNAIEDMLQDWANRISASIGGMVVQLQETPLDASAQEAICERIRGWHEYLEGVEEQLLELRRERRGDPLKLFAGSWPPSAPLDLLAMRATLLEDFDTISAASDDYLGDEDFGEGSGPLGEAFAEVNGILQRLAPETPEAATAIHFAWQADDELGLGDSWGEGQVALASEKALPRLPRPY